MSRSSHLRVGRVAAACADWMIAAGIGLATFAPIVFLVELLEWGMTGQWPGWTVEDGLMFFGLEEPLAYFSLTQFMLDIVTDLPLAFVVYLAGLASVSLAFNFVDPIPTARMPR